MHEKNKPKDNVFHGFFIHDCCIAAKDCFYVSAEKQLSTKKYDYYTNRGSTRLGFYDSKVQTPNQPPTWTGITWKGHSFFNTRLVNTAERECLMMDDAGQGYYIGLGDEAFAEKQLPTKTRFHQIVRVGEQVYGIGWGREVFKRIGPEDWQCISEDIREHGSGHGFEDMDGFSDDDLYAVGGQNDVWHFDGTAWRYIDIGEKQLLPLSVCCADNGDVYIGCAWGYVIRGRGEIWSVFATGKNTKFCDTVAYQGRVFFGSEDGVFVADQTSETFTCQPYDFKKQIAPLSARRLDARYGKLLAASSVSVALYDGKRWQYLYGAPPPPRHKQRGRLP